MPHQRLGQRLSPSAFLRIPPHGYGINVGFIIQRHSQPAGSLVNELHLKGGSRLDRRSAEGNRLVNPRPLSGEIDTMAGGGIELVSQNISGKVALLPDITPVFSGD